MVWELISGWIISLLVLGFIDWRSHQKLIGDRQQLERENREIAERADRVKLTLENQLTDTRAKLESADLNNAKLERDIVALDRQCQRLREELKERSTQAQTDAIDGGFDRIQTLLTQFPSVRKMVEIQPDLPARNLVALLTSLENLVKYWGCESIGTPWDLVAYDPQLHQADTEDLELDELVYVRFIGYKKGNRILIPAKVSRTLPAGLTKS